MDTLKDKFQISKSKCQINVKFQNGILNQVQNDTFVMPNQVLNLIQDLRFRHLIWALELIWHLNFGI
jgi:hypothetical protein